VCNNRDRDSRALVRLGVTGIKTSERDVDSVKDIWLRRPRSRVLVRSETVTRSQRSGNNMPTSLIGRMIRSGSPSQNTDARSYELATAIGPYVRIAVLSKACRQGFGGRVSQTDRMTRQGSGCVSG